RRACGFRLLDRGGGRRGDFLLAHRLGQERLDDVDLTAFLRGAFGAAALLVGFGRFLALAHHSREDFQYPGILAGRAAGTAMRNVAVLDGGEDQPQRGKALAVARLLGGLHGFGEFPAHRRESPCPLAIAMREKQRYMSVRGDMACAPILRNPANPELETCPWRFCKAIRSLSRSHGTRRRPLPCSSLLTGRSWRAGDTAPSAAG